MIEEGWQYSDGNTYGTYFVTHPVDGLPFRAATVRQTKLGGWDWSVYKPVGGLHAEAIDCDEGESSRVVAEALCEKYMYELGLIFDPDR